MRRVIVPAVLPQIYRDQRILLGWAWTYLIVAELIGTSSGITFFITQQARYQHFDNVYAGILVIGFVGIATDIVLALLGAQAVPLGEGGRMTTPVWRHEPSPTATRRRRCARASTG